MDGENYRKTCDYLSIYIVNPNFLPITNADSSDEKNAIKNLMSIINLNVF